MTTHTSRPDDLQWQAIAHRDISLEEAFRFGVLSTGVYCRPGCPARTPARAKVQTFADSTQARAAGFRACKRCHPDGLSDTQATRVLVEAACARINSATPPPPLAVLASEAGMSAAHFQRVFKSVVGLSPKQYARARRMQRSRDALHAGARITTALHGAGYGSATRFHADSDAALGMPARRYREGGRGETIEHAFGNSSLGRVLVASTAKGVCLIAMGDDDATLHADLVKRFPNAEHRAASAERIALLADVMAAIDTPGEPSSLPLDIRGTVFQQRVWQALRGIPAGKTVTYGELATAIGQPTATRAVATACGANKLAVVIPCHRVIGADGTLTGYRWGVGRKQALLERERGP